MSIFEFASLIGLLLTAYSIGYMHEEERQKKINRRP